MLPIWAPNVHPLIIHFPIGLLITAVIIHVVTILIKDKPWVESTVNLLYIIGTFFTGVAYLTGRDAADNIKFPTEAFPVVSRHADLALWTLCLFGLLTILRVFFRWKKVHLILPYRLTMVILAITACGFLFRTGEFGARLVFGHGVGIYSLNDQTAMADSIPTGMKYETDGSWTWKSSSTDKDILTSHFKLMKGATRSVNSSIHQDDNMNQLDMDLKNSDQIYITGESTGSVQATASFNIDNFTGEFFLIHHFQDVLNFDFLTIKNNQLALGRTTEGNTHILASEVISISGWNTMSVVGDGKHFRGYVNDELILHAHQSALKPGFTGFGFSGNGKLSLREIRVSTLG